MGDATGFMKHAREMPTRRPVPVRLRDWKEVYEPFPEAKLRTQASRCMDCGIPFCNNGCPLGNLIPDWNDLVYRDHWRDAIERLHATNNFPEFTGRLCPAPCEAACVLGINADPVTIKQVEVEIINRAWNEGWVAPVPADVKTGKRVAVVGSGPSGLAAAQQLTRAGHDVVVFERADRPGGLLRYGIPEFKMEKAVLDRRLDQMRAEGTEFRCNVNVGVDVPVSQLREEFDAIVLAGGATAWRDLPIPGRELEGIYQAMEYLPGSNRVQEGDIPEPPVTAAGKRVVIIGGGDTGADCLGTAHRQGAASVHQFEIMPRPPDHRPDSTPWPTWPLMFRTSSAHEEGGERVFSVNTECFVGENGKLAALRGHEVEQKFIDGRMVFEKIEGTDFDLPCELVLLAMGFVGPERGGLLDELGVEINQRGNVARNGTWATTVDGVFVCGDMGRGQSLIVWAIAEGRSCAASVDQWLMGETALPAPLAASSAFWRDRSSCSSSRATSASALSTSRSALSTASSYLRWRSASSAFRPSSSAAGSASGSASGTSVSPPSSPKPEGASISFSRWPSCNAAAASGSTDAASNDAVSASCWAALAAPPGNKPAASVTNFFTTSRRWAAAARSASAPFPLADSARRWAADNSSPAAMSSSMPVGLRRASWLRAHATTVGRRSLLTVAAASRSPSAFSCLASALRRSTNSAGSTEYRSSIGSPMPPRTHAGCRASPSTTRSSRR
jgi:glutamate synthase (NADPH) small chain